MFLCWSTFDDVYKQEIFVLVSILLVKLIKTSKLGIIVLMSITPQQCTATCNRELGIPQPTVYKMLRKRLKFKPRSLKLLKALKPN